MKQTVLVLSCEHAVNTIPDALKSRFENTHLPIQPHKAMDIGALHITQYLSKKLNCDFTQTVVSRLLIDCNRSLSHERCFSKYTRTWSNAEKQMLIETYYTPFREKTKQLIDTHIKANRQVLHLSVHTFAPILKGLLQHAGIGLLYDSKRHGEKEVARLWHGLLLQETPSYRIRYNYPFPGNSDSFTKTLRHLYTEHDYLGIEMEINQALFDNQTTEEELAVALAHSLEELLALL